MYQEITTEITDDELEIWNEASNKERESMIQDMFGKLDDHEIATLLSGFCFNTLEKYNGLDSVTDVSFDSEFEGYITVDFTGNAYFGCDDMDKYYEHEEGVTFSINLQKQRITFTTTTPEIPDRDPENY